MHGCMFVNPHTVCGAKFRSYHIIVRYHKAVVCRIRLAVLRREAVIALHRNAGETILSQNVPLEKRNECADRGRGSPCRNVPKLRIAAVRAMRSYDHTS